ncbi:MAG: enoyl-CoA hydratase [Chloroflexi bacterium]|nr:enoyl-CoA hydratase [Chloroflexota bacterium]
MVLIEKSEGIATVTLNRPEAMNALSSALRHALADAFKALQADGNIRVVILTGAGRAFCAGMDLKEAAAGAGDQVAFEEEGDIVQEAMTAFDRPIIGAINGHAITAGFELALSCDMLIVSSEAKFADTHVRVGMLPGWGLSQRLPRLIGITRAKELSFTGNYLTAQQAEAWGMVNRVVPPEELLPTCRKLAQDIASCDPRVVKAYKRLIDKGFGMNFADAMAHESAIALDWARKITAGAIAARREGVIERGRKQDSSEG